MTKRLTYKFVKEYIEFMGFKLKNEYINSYTKLKLQCSKGHDYKVTWNVFQQGHGCPYCTGKAKLTYEYVKEQIESIEGYKLINKTYKNNNTKLEIQCNEGHNYKVTWNSWQQGKKCPICDINNRKLTYEYVKEQIKKEGYKLLSKEYTNAHTKLKLQCIKEHNYEASWGSWQQGHKCPVCNNKKISSKAEKEIFKIVKQLLPNENIIENDRTQVFNFKTGYNLELDIWIPELKKAIEFNGEYWHSSDDVKFKDVEKVKQCKEKGINLLVMKEQNWLDDKNECIKQIKNWIF